MKSSDRFAAAETNVLVGLAKRSARYPRINKCQKHKWMQMASNSSCFALSAERMALTHILRVRKAVCFVCLDYALLCHWGQKKNIACPTAQEPGARHRAKGETKQRREVAEKSSCMFLLTSKSLGTECLNLLEFASLVLLQRTSLMSAFGAATAF